MKKQMDSDHQELSPPTGKIIGRQKEQKLVKELLGSKNAEFIAIYGRRRVGKTYLIKNMIDSFPCKFLHVTGLQKGSLKNQLETFTTRLGVTFYQGVPLKPYKSWMDAFEALSQAIAKTPKSEKIVIFLDELPWMATPRSKLLMVLELYWNQHWVFDPRIKLIICGSATSWIINNIINDKGGLHNRVTRTIHLHPFSLSEVESYLQEKKIKLSHRQILDLYVVLGGVPLYWFWMRKGKTAHEMIDELCFQKGGPLVKEFDRLFASLFEDPKPYISLIRIIGKHRYGIGQAELLSKSKLPSGGSTVRKLRELEEAGFITSLVPYKHTDKGVYYLVDDEYSLFYLYWIEPNLKSLAKKESLEGFWLSQSQQPSWRSWEGYAFESVCYKHIHQIRRALNIDPGALAGSWRYNPRTKDEEGAQIDLLFDRPDNAITLCEIKCSSEPFAIDKNYANILRRKERIFRKHTRTKKQLFLAMITTHGLRPTIYSEDMVTNEATLEDLFKET